MCIRDSLYAVPGQKPGDKGQIYMQSQEGFNYDLPPVRLSEKERDHLVQQIQELERVTYDVSEDDHLGNISEKRSDKGKQATENTVFNAKPSPLKSKMPKLPQNMNYGGGKLPLYKQLGRPTADISDSEKR